MVAPGLIDTPLGRRATQGRPSRGRTPVPLGRQGTAWEVAAPVVFLLSDDASYITGQVARGRRRVVHALTWGYGDERIRGCGGRDAVPDVGVHGAGACAKGSRRNQAVRIAGLALVVGSLIVSTAPPGWAASTVPSAPRSVRMTPGNGTATVRWRAPVDTGGRPVTQYEVIPYLDNFALPTNVFSSTATSEVIFGLKNGKSYTFKVAAKNSVGWSRLSARSGFVTVGVPLPPGKTTAVAGRGRATVSWHPAPSNNGSAVNSYRVTPLLDGAAQTARVFSSTQTHQVITGLVGGGPYTFEVAAHNRNGWSAPSNDSVSIVVGK